MVRAAANSSEQEESAITNLTFRQPPKEKIKSFSFRILSKKVLSQTSRARASEKDFSAVFTVKAKKKIAVRESVLTLSRSIDVNCVERNAINDKTEEEEEKSNELNCCNYGQIGFVNVYFCNSFWLR